MSLPTNGYRHLVTISDKDGNTAALVFDGSVWRLAVDAILGGPIIIGSVVVSGVIPGVTIANPADIPLPAPGVVPLPVAPPGTRRMTVQVTLGSALTMVRVRPVGAPAGSGRLLLYTGSTLYGGADGAIAPMEVELIAGPASAVHVDFEV